jgi:hypothetical protein
MIPRDEISLLEFYYGKWLINRFHGLIFSLLDWLLWKVFDKCIPRAEITLLERLLWKVVYKWIPRAEISLLE